MKLETNRERAWAKAHTECVIQRAREAERLCQLAAQEEVEYLFPVINQHSIKADEPCHLECAPETETAALEATETDEYPCLRALAIGMLLGSLLFAVAWVLATCYVR